MADHLVGWSTMNKSASGSSTHHCNAHSFAPCASMHSCYLTLLFWEPGAASRRTDSGTERWVLAAVLGPDYTAGWYWLREDWDLNVNPPLAWLVRRRLPAWASSSLSVHLDGFHPGHTLCSLVDISGTAEGDTGQHGPD